MPIDTTSGSPCIGICCLNEATRLCEGCWRTIEEIARWPSLDERGRRAILAAIECRKSEISD